MTEIAIPELTLRDSLYAIYSIHEYRWAAVYGKFYPPGFFTGRQHFYGIFNESRRAALYLSRQPCIVCDEPIPETSRYDHLIPTSQGGRDSISNIMPLCRRHNSSKGKKDLFEWAGWWENWTRIPVETSLDILCIYAREKRYTAGMQGRLSNFASESDLNGLQKVSDEYLPTGFLGEHFKAMVEGIDLWKIE